MTDLNVLEIAVLAVLAAGFAVVGWVARARRAVRHLLREQARHDREVGGLKRQFDQVAEAEQDADPDIVHRGLDPDDTGGSQ